MKAPRYREKVHEVGPLARIAVSYAKGNKEIREMVDSVLAHFKASPEVLFSVLGRHAARDVPQHLLLSVHHRGYDAYEILVARKDAGGVSDLHYKLVAPPALLKAHHQKHYGKYQKQCF